MQFSDFLDPRKGPETLVRLALYPLLVLVVGSLAITILSQLNAGELLGGMVFLMLVSPLAYLIREHRRGHRQQPQTRRGAERTPLPPQNEEDT